MPDGHAFDISVNPAHAAQGIRPLSTEPILMITTFAETGDELDGLVAGASAYLTKLFRPGRLRPPVQELRRPSQAPLPRSLAVARTGSAGYSWRRLT
ncbi:hypothetical protein PV760_13795 [Paenarthrobacter sp. CC6]|uniref:hypothetical protein n=1 Tax=Paenarthrobacter sp. CC6 TaxID=3029184 RepID=UPI00339C4BAA